MQQQWRQTIKFISALNVNQKCRTLSRNLCHTFIERTLRPKPRLQCRPTWTADDVTSGWITGVMSTSVRITSDTVDRTVRRVVVGVAVQLVFERQTTPYTHWVNESQPNKRQNASRGISTTAARCRALRGSDTNWRKQRNAHPWRKYAIWLNTETLQRALLTICTATTYTYIAVWLSASQCYLSRARPLITSAFGLSSRVQRRSMLRLEHK